MGRLLTYDALEASVPEFKVRRDPACPACGDGVEEIVIAEYDDFCMLDVSSDPAGALGNLPVKPEWALR